MSRRIFPLADDYVSRAFLAGGMFAFAGLFATAPALYFDDRLLNGAPIWWKPLKFWLAIGVHLLTLAVLAQLLAPAARRNLALKAAAFLAVASAVLENVYITVQAARGRASHFNYDTPLEANLYLAMGAGALLLVMAPLVIGVLIAAERDGLGKGLKTGAVLGLIVGPVLTIAFAGYMSVYGDHFYAAPAGADDVGGVPLFGWSPRYADLRPAHFVATHLIQIGPLVGVAADRLAPGAAGRIAAASVILLAALAAALFAIALGGASPVAFLAD
jgi:hypothetical protein